MPFSFTLCAECLAKYRALTYDPNARHSPCLIPFDCIVWSDEHPPAGTTVFYGHEACRHSLIRLISARKSLWRTGQISDGLGQVWREAQEIMPDWPGFRRLTLSAEELQALDFCEAETADMMGQLRSDASIFALSDEGGGVVSFVAHPPASRPTDEVRPLRSGDSPLPKGSNPGN